MVDKASSDVELNKIIEKLLSVRSQKVQKGVNLTETEIKNIISKAIEVIMTQPMVLELEAPIKVCGKSFRPGKIKNLIIQARFI
jgi:serine/threonine-protein phosphatase PP1 catalytic subunit